MRIHVRYCNICQKKIPDLEWETEEALEWENFFYCAEHAEQGTAIVDRMIREREEKQRIKEQEDAKARVIEEAEARVRAREEDEQRRQHLSQVAPKRSPLTSRGKQTGRGKGYRGKGSISDRRPISRRSQSVEEGEEGARKSDSDIRRKASASGTGSRVMKGQASPKRSSSKRLRAVRTQASRRAMAASGRHRISGRKPVQKHSTAIWIIFAASMAIIIGIIIVLIFTLSGKKPEQPRSEVIEKPEPWPEQPWPKPVPPVILHERFRIKEFVDRVYEWKGDEGTYSALGAELRKAGGEADPTDQETRDSIARAFGQLKNRRETLAEQAGSAIRIEIQGLMLAGNAAGIELKLESYPRVFHESRYGSDNFSPYMKEIGTLLSDVEKFESIRLPDELTGYDAAKLEEVRKTLDGFTRFPEDSAWRKRVQDIRSLVDKELTSRSQATETEMREKRQSELDGVLGGAEALEKTGRPETAIKRLQAFTDKYPGTPEAGEAEARIREIMAKIEASYLARFFPGDGHAGWDVEPGAVVNVNGGVAVLRNAARDGRDAGFFKGKSYWRDYEVRFSFMRKAGMLSLFLRADSGSGNAQDDAVEFDGPLFKAGVWYDVSVKLTGGVLEITTSLDGTTYRRTIAARSGGIGFRVGSGGEAGIKKIKVILSR